MNTIGNSDNMGLNELFTSRLNTTTKPQSSTPQPGTIEASENQDMLAFLSSLSGANAAQATQKASEVANDVDSSAQADAGKSRVDWVSKIEDTFTPSRELSAAINAREYVKNGLADADSFRSMARQLQNDGVLNCDDMMAVDFLSTKSPNISLKDFDAMIKNDSLSREMRGLIAQLVQKLHMVNYISGGLMSA
ncbi:hypothetical protein BKN38_07715 [Helicobacter sp. CLO-3]|uniref:hypothetical protein n=1 Tax=unclassified Helicobacter TaxID=2593540 RepID=UPI0008055860|nr:MULTISPECIES: hypothetical protein [unclassified Helicobacter]OBV28384.1 hypothetical protein BA723_09600 [Helicobacter sp. CLO-3]OHU82031.1 hypothetical protein BKN38_07715 [Helicobacter sp. CLO-3]